MTANNDLLAGQGYLGRELITRDGAPVGGLSKRTFDICFAVSALLLFLPLILLVMICVKSQDNGPVFFGHKRVGRNGRSFRCLKFRTMRTDGDAVFAEYLASNPSAREEWLTSRKLKNDPRVTLFGGLLRKTSLDELPQILNILLGDMSVVGPRPVVSEELAMYGTEAARYLAARPGLTGPWQVSGRNDTTYAERVRLDAAYVEHWSFFRDLLLIARTIPAVFMIRGSY